MRHFRFFNFACGALLAFAGMQSWLLGHGLPDGNFEGRHTHSIGLTPDGTRLLALNTPDGRLSVFNVTNPANPAPVLIAEIPVGFEPVSLRARTNDEVWVVNEVGDSVSVVSLSLGVVVATLPVPDEPADVIFAQGKAFVSCARSNLLRVFDAVTRQPLPSIPLQGLYPRALATDAGGTKIFAAFLLSGNGTTVLPAAQAPAPPPPTNPALPPAPQTALIVAANDPRIDYTVLDRDAVEIDAVTGQVTRYLGGAGTHLFDIAIQPGTGDPWIANSDARNLVRFEPALRGHVADHRLTRLDHVSGTPVIFDLNPGLDYGLLPNPAALASSLAQPTALAFASDGSEVWVAAFGSDRVARVTAATGAVLARVELRSTGQTTRQMRGPRALALLESRQRLYTLNTISNTISVIGTAGGSLLAEVPAGSHDPIFASVREGRAFFYDARLSGNGTISCATCHLDADADGLAWDLGNPAGDEDTVFGANLNTGDPTIRPRTVHPMKGPMLTQSLRLLVEGEPFQRRGDRPTLQDFNPIFDTLMGGTQLPAPDMESLVAYLLTLRPHPNPNRLLDDTLPATFMGGDPIRGETLFNDPAHRCADCHADESIATNNIDLPSVFGAVQPIKNPSLRTVYQRLLFNPTPGGNSLSGFGLGHDGSRLFQQGPGPHAFSDPDLDVFIQCIETGMPPSIGLGLTFNVQDTADAALLAKVAILEEHSEAFEIELAVQGVVGGRCRAYFYNSTTQRYRADATTDAALTRSALLALLSGSDAITFIGVPNGRGSRLGGDHNSDAILDGDEPLPVLQANRVGPNVHLQWPAQPAGWVLESTADLNAPWEVVTHPHSLVGATLHLDDPAADVAARYYRLRRTW